ncbi:neutral zinc metallopeptidase [Pseudonocardia eucalypti]|uniref:Neutral zinc metallopeptidase n=1 Tax=Pseudonocardia eucalypti TaxID=648755 RepID=A0ABP9Q5X2_9PSEU|nr:hypothetical protein [Pseudonocardia eucalypti]
MGATLGDRRRATVTALAVAAMTLVAVSLTGCSFLSGGSSDGGPDITELTQPDTSPPPVTPIRGGTGTPSDRLAADVVHDVEAYWHLRFPPEFGRRWIPLHAFHAVDPAKPNLPPECTRRPIDMNKQALYCPAMDVIIWDRLGLVPELRAKYGNGGVLLALAHEVGHAVQERIGIDVGTQIRERSRYPPILLEAMADCFAGVVVRASVNGELAHVRIEEKDLDRALSALLSFRDPVGFELGPNAHGDAFDRASAFLDGYQNGASRCAAMTAQNQLFTQRGFTTVQELLQSGNLPLDELLASMVPDTQAWFTALVSSRGRRWAAPPLRPDSGCSSSSAARQGPVRFCPDSGTLSASPATLGSVHSRGDYATGTLVASRYALAALAALGKPVRGPDAGRAAVCLAGAYTRSLLDRNTSGFGLSPGDVDEAVDELLNQDYAARDATGTPPADQGFQRVGAFREGTLGGAAKCGI